MDVIGLAKSRMRSRPNWPKKPQRKAEKKTEQARRDHEWLERAAELAAEDEQRRKEQGAILAGSWECARCLTPAEVNGPYAGFMYALTCRRCRRTAHAVHAELAAIVNARKSALSPATAG